MPFFQILKFLAAQGQILSAHTVRHNLIKKGTGRWYLKSGDFTQKSGVLASFLGSSNNVAVAEMVLRAVCPEGTPLLFY